MIVQKRVGDGMKLPGHSKVMVATNRDELEDVFRFWYRIYVKEMGKRFTYADHGAETLRDALTENSMVFYITDDEGIIATLRITPGDAPGIPEEIVSFYDLKQFGEFSSKEISFSSRLIVKESWRGSSLVGLLIMEAFRGFMSQGHRFNFAYCAPELVQLYERLGMRRYKDNLYDSNVGLRIPMVLITGDHDHFRAVRSPFLRLCANHHPDGEAVGWFNGTFRSLPVNMPTGTMRESDLWHFFQTRLREQDIQLFAGMGEEEITRFLKAGTIIACKAGERVVRRGEVGHEMFLILSGGVEVRYQKEGREHLLDTFNRGEIFGEMAFVSELPRSADVVAISDVELLIINQRFLEKMAKISPELSSRILLNLAVVLCHRLRTTTLGWVRSIDYFRLPNEEKTP
jgi:predicted GNAT family N-acyltransferase